MNGFGEILTQLRIKRGFTQDQLADALDIKRARYNSWENNIAKPDIEMLAKIAKYHDVTTDYLLGTDDPQPISIAAHRSDDPLSVLPPEARKSLEEFQDYILRKYGLKKD